MCISQSINVSARKYREFNKIASITCILQSINVPTRKHRKFGTITNIVHIQYLKFGTIRIFICTRQSIDIITRKYKKHKRNSDKGNMVKLFARFEKFLYDGHVTFQMMT